MRRLLALGFALATLALSAQEKPLFAVRRGRVGVTGPALVRGDGTAVAFPRPPTSGEVIVAFKSKPRTDAAVQRLARFRADLAVIERARSAKAGQKAPAIRREYHALYSGVALTASADVLESIRKLDYVASIHPDVEVEALLDRSVPLIGADRLWTDAGTRGAGVVVAVIDTGIDYNHPALAGKFIGGHDFANNDSDPMDDHGHGTHVAGIIAADGEVTGVAPGVSLLAYKVLSAGGGGRISDVIAGIERAVDPDDDGDFSDAADVINLSLGSRLGSPDDPASIAVDNAVAAGVVVCIAAGNAGAGFSIGSPAMARSAITVGATNDDDVLASFSSRGPNANIYSIKPEVTAPGQAIRSTLRNGQYGDLSGTSMATPHVAGAAALLLAIHPTWTPADVKSALVNSAHAVAGEVMAVGAGRIDVFAAARQSVRAEPPALSYGLADGASPEWSAAQTIQLTNHADAPRSFTLGEVTGLRAGVAVTMNPPSLELPANGSATVEIRVTVTNGEVPYPRTQTLSYGGLVSLVADGQSLHVPWGFVKAARVVIRDGENWTEAVLDDGQTPWVARRGTQPLRTEVLVPAGTYDVVMFAPTTTGADDYYNPHVVIREQQPIEGTVAYDLDANAWPYTLRFAGVDEQGTALSELERSGTAEYASRMSLRIDGGSDWFLDSWIMPGTHVNTSAMTGRVKLFVGEYFNDTRRRVAYVIQHPPPGAIDASRDLTTTPAALVAQDTVTETPPDLGADSGVASMFARFHHFPDYNYVENIGLLLTPIEDRQVGMRLYLTPDPDPRSGYSTDLMLFHPSAFTFYDFLTDPFRVTAGGRVTNTVEPTASPRSVLTSSSEVRRFGLAPFWPALTAFANTDRLYVFGQYRGAHGEYRVRDWVEKRYRLFNEEGAEIASGQGSVSVPLSALGKYRVEVTSDLYHVGDARGRATLAATFDTRAADRIFPSLTSLYLRDPAGGVVFDVPRGRPVTLEFSAADYVFAETYAGYRQPDLGRTKAWVRRAGQTEWQELPVTAGEEEAGRSDELGHWPTGVVWRASLAAVTGTLGAVDVRIAIADTGGNTVEWTLEPAFRVVDAPRKRRSVR